MNRKQDLLIIAIALLKFILPFVLSDTSFGLHRDEFLYYQQGQHPAFGYMENPPLLSGLALVSGGLGGSFFWIKFWPALFGALTVVVTAAIARQMGGNWLAQAVAALGICFSAYLRIHFLFQPNFLEIFFWTLSVYFLLRYVNSGVTANLYPFALSLALAFLSKYSAVFFITALFLSLLATKHRSVFLKKDLWIACGLAFILVAPNLYWQWSHRFPLIHHMKELRETQLRFISRVTFLKEQLLLLLPFLFIWIGGCYWLARSARYAFIFLTYLLLIVLLMWGSGKGYYALGAYPMLLAAGGCWLERVTAGRTWLLVTLMAIVLLLSVSTIRLLLPTQPPAQMEAWNKSRNIAALGLLKWEDLKDHPLQQDFADMLGWKELAEKTERFYHSLPDSTRERTMVLAGNYGQAGALKYYAKDTAFINRVCSSNGSFLLWLPDHPGFHHIIDIDEDDPQPEEPLFRQFSSMRMIDSVTDPYARERGTKIMFFQNASDSARLIAGTIIRQIKGQYLR